MKTNFKATVSITLTALLLSLALVGFNAFPVLAQKEKENQGREDFIVTVGQDKVFTEFNYHDAWFENDPIILNLGQMRERHILKVI